MKKIRRLIALFLFLSLLFCSCAPATPGPLGSEGKETEPRKTDSETERETEPDTGTSGTEHGETGSSETEPGETSPGTEPHGTEPPVSLDLSGVTFPSGTFLADGEAHSIFAEGKLPSGVRVEYEGNGKTAPGTYPVTARFTADGFAPAVMTATLTLLSGLDRVGPAVFTDETYTELFVLDPAFADTEYRVPNGTVRLFPGAMADSAVTSLYVPASVTEIGDFAFGYRKNAAGTYVRNTGITVYGEAGSTAESYCKRAGIAFSTAAALSVQSAEDLYAQDGLTLLLSSFRGIQNADPAKGIWRATVGQNVTLEGGAYDKGLRPAGWRIAEDGGVYYRIATMDQFRSYRATTGIVLAADALQKDGKASDFTVETVFLPLGLAGEDGIVIDHGTDVGNKGYSQYGAYAGSRSTFAFAGLQMCFFHYSTAESGNSMATRLFYQSNAWEAADVVGGGGVMSNTTYTDHLLFSLDRNGWAEGQQYLRVTRTLGDVADFQRTTFLVEAPYGSVTKDNANKPSTFYETSQLPHPFEMFFAFPAVVYSIRVYDHPLTEKEILQNHFADLCAYFGLDLSLLDHLLPPSLPAVYAALAEYDFSSSAADVTAAYTAACTHAPRYRLTVRCETPDGTLIRTAEYALPDGEPYTVSAPVVPGYTTRALTFSGEMHGGSTVTLSYFPTSGTDITLPKIVFVGDDLAAGIGSSSLSGFTSAGIDPVSVGSTRYGASAAAVLQNLLRARVGGVNVSAFGVMDEDLVTVASRLGTVQDHITLGAAVTVAPGATVNVSLVQNGNGILRNGGDPAVNPVTIEGHDGGGNVVSVSGYFTVSATNGNPGTASLGELRYTFTRTDPGEQNVTLSAGALVHTATESAARGAWLVLFVGEHGGYVDTQDLVSRLQKMAASAKADRVLVVGSLSGDRNANAQTDAALTSAFGDRYVDPRKALGDVLSAFGISSSGYASAIAEGSVPSLFLQDKTHLGAFGHAALARVLLDRMSALGWFEEIFDTLEAAASAPVCFAPEER